MKLKLPSIHTLWLSFLKVVSRFPLQVLVALAATISWCILVDTDKNSEDQLTVFIVVCNLALTLLLAADLYSEANAFTKGKQWMLRMLAVVICTVLYFVLKPSFYLADLYRIGLLAFAFHLLVAFSPFINRENRNGFWQFNKALFLRFLTSALYAVVLYAGLAIALAAVHGLFNVKIGWEIYMRLFAVVTAGFMTLFFLSGVPDNFDALEKDESYPKGLKIFTQYVLIPLMTIYLVILLVYEVKIAINWELPKGLVSMLILGYSVFGILSLLLVYPIKEKEGNGWMKLFSRFFYVMMIPLVVLLLLAVWKRVGSYGITESRYILVILAVWLSAITVYFLISSKQNIKIIPVSLCILALLATYGPQSVFSISKYSQVSRLKHLMASTKTKDVDQRAEVVDYLVDRHGLSSLQSFTKVNLSDLEVKLEKDTALSRYAIKNNKTDTAYALLKVKKAERSYRDTKRFLLQDEGVVAVSGYDYIVRIENYTNEFTANVKGVKIKVQKVGAYGNLRVSMGVVPAIEFDLKTLATNAIAQFKSGKLNEKANDGVTYYLPPASLSMSKPLGNFEIKLVLTSLETTMFTDDPEELEKWLGYEGFLLISIK